jgi:hypothetical protein
MGSNNLAYMADTFGDEQSVPITFLPLTNQPAD